MTPGESHAVADAPSSDDDCLCAEYIDGEFPCRSPGEEDCPRHAWLETFEAEGIVADGEDPEAREEIDRLADALDLPHDVTETAVWLFAYAREEGFVSGRTVEGVAAAAVYAAARQSGLPRTLEEVASTTAASRREIGRDHRQFARDLDLPVKPVSPAEHLPRYAAELDLSARTEEVARRLLVAAEDRGLQGGRNPVSLVAAAVYAAGLLTDTQIHQSHISEVTGVGEPTISDLYHELLEELSVLSEDG